jgi:hypothetical protein
MIDYASLRVDSDHEEFPKGGRSWCDVCGWVDKLEPASLMVALWHGDSFGSDTRPLDDLDSWSRRLGMVAAKHERTGGPDEQELADIGRSS